MANPDTVTDRRIEEYARPMRSAAHRAAYLRCALSVVPPDLDRITARYPEITVPALCLWGDRDRVVPLAGGRRLAGELPGGRLVVVPQCGHQVVEERPDASVRVFRDFLVAENGPYAEGSPSSATGRPPSPRASSGGAASSSPDSGDSLDTAGS